jgi:hypothetical protein
MVVHILVARMYFYVLYAVASLGNYLMLAELKFVMGAVAKKGLIPSMTHFRIEGGHVRSYDGTMAISSPIALDIDCAPQAAALVKAISNCEDATTITLTPAGRLSIRSGAFRALVPTIDGPTPHVAPGGELIHFDGELLLKAFGILEPFIGTDASRLFTTGILLADGCAYATNNVCMAQYWLGNVIPHTINIPRKMIREVLRVGEAPSHGQLDADSITFHYSDGRWIRCQLIRDVWPLEKVNALLDSPSNALPIDPNMFVGLRKIEAMTDGASRVYMMDGALRTSTDPEEGAMYELTLPSEGCYNMKMLGLLEGVVTHMDMTLYPGPCLFFGERLRGAIIGMMM